MTQRNGGDFGFEEWGASGRFDPIDPIESLRSMPAAPDLAGSILGAVDRRRGLMDYKGVRLLWCARWGLAALALATLAGVFVLKQTAPVERALGVEEGPVARVVEAVARGSTEAVRGRRGSVIRVSRSYVDESFGRALIAAADRRVESAGTEFSIRIAPPHVCGNLAPEPAPALAAPVADFNGWSHGYAGLQHTGLQPTGLPTTGLPWPDPLAEPLTADYLAGLEALTLPSSR